MRTASVAWCINQEPIRPQSIAPTHLQDLPQEPTDSPFPFRPSPTVKTPGLEKITTTPATPSISPVPHPSSTPTMLPPTPTLPRELEAMLCLSQPRTSHK